MTGTIPQCEGWIRSHQDVVSKTACVFTIEHLGAPEWVETADGGYAASGRNEYMNCPASPGSARRPSGARHHRGLGLPRHGVPHAGFICGPNYLLGVTANGHIDKLDADLAARQMAMLAELITAVEAIDAATLRATDQSLGEKPVNGPDTSCAA